MRRVILAGLLLLTPSIGHAQLHYWPPAGTAGGGTWGTITGTIGDQTDLGTALAAKCALGGCTMTGAILTATGCTTPDFSFTSDTDAGLCLFNANEVRLQTAALGTASSSSLVGTASAMGMAYYNASAAQSAFQAEDSVARIYIAGILHGQFDANGLTVGNASSHDRLILAPAVIGGGAFTGAITSADLTAGRTWTLPNSSGTVPAVGVGFAVVTAAGASVERTLVAGEGITTSNPAGTAGNPTNASDRAVVMFKGAGTADPPATCGDTGDSFQISDNYIETDTKEMYTCNAIDHWTLFGHVTDDKVLVGTGTDAVLETIPDCDDLAGNHMNYNTTGTPGSRFSCGTTGAAAGVMPRPNTKRSVHCGVNSAATDSWLCVGAARSQTYGAAEWQASDSTDGFGFRVDTTGTSGNAAWVGAAEGYQDFRVGRNVYFETSVRAVQTTNHRLFLGFTSTETSGTYLGSDDPVISGAWFRYSTAAPDTNWQCITNDGASGGTITDSGIAAGTTNHEFAIVENPSVDWKFYIDGALVCTNSTNQPAAGALSLRTGIVTLENVVKKFVVAWDYVEIDK